jgi:DNA-binding NtrC family response regulator
MARQKAMPRHRASVRAAPVFIGHSEAAEKVRTQIKLLQNALDVKVLILGESGTGKEVVASLLHQQEIPRAAARPFIAVNMAALPSTLVESELFGVERGAYTDAKNSRPGKFELADGGDLFLDEIGDLNLDAQAKLLRALQEKLVQRVGSSRTRSVDFRLISATNLDLSARIRQGHFREDLAFRIADFVLELPPLRERREDIALLANHFLQQCAPHRYIQIAPHVLRQMLRYHWPGNVRQLESTMKRAMVLNPGTRIEEVDFLDRIFYSPALPPTLAAAKRHPKNRKRAWEELGISKATFYRRLKEIEED